MSDEPMAPTVAPGLVTFVCLCLALWFAFVDPERVMFMASIAGAVTAAGITGMLRVYSTQMTTEVYSDG